MNQKPSKRHIFKIILRNLYKNFTDKTERVEVPTGKFFEIHKGGKMIQYTKEKIVPRTWKSKISKIKTSIKNFKKLNNKKYSPYIKYIQFSRSLHEDWYKFNPYL